MEVPAQVKIISDGMRLVKPNFFSFVFGGTRVETVMRAVRMIDNREMDETHTRLPNFFVRSFKRSRRSCLS